MNIILGAFGTDTFDYLKSEYQLEKFCASTWNFKDTNPIFRDSSNAPLMVNMLRLVNWAMSECNEIYFDITYLDLEVREFTDECRTFNELLLCITTPEYLAKTRFFIDGIEQNKDEIVNKFIFQEYWNQFL